MMKTHLDKFPLDGYVIPENGYITLAASKKELPFKLSSSDGEDLFLSDGEKQALYRQGGSAGDGS